MPGILGITSAVAHINVDRLLNPMLAEMKECSRYVVERGRGPGGSVALGRVSLGFIERFPQPASVPESKAMAVLCGELYDAAEQRATLRAGGVEFVGDGHAELLLRGYLHSGKSFFQKLNGKFSAAIWDGIRNRLILTNDQFGMMPLYYANSAGRFVFASEIKSLLIDDGVSRGRNERGIAQFFSFGHLWGNDTFYDEIRVLPPAAWLTYDTVDDRLMVDRYWQMESRVAGSNVSEADMLDRVDAAFQRAVRVRVGGDARLGLSLSGGLDARSILATIDHSHVRPTCLTMGMEGSLDHRCAKKMAELAGCPYHEFVLDDRFLSDFRQHLNRMVHLTDGHYLSQCIVIPTLEKYRELGIQVLLRGHAGELMHMHKAYNFSLDGSALAIRDEASLEEWLFEHLRAYMLDGLDEPLFTFMSTEELEDSARESLRECLAESAGWEPISHRIWHLFVTQRLRRETAMSLVKFGSVVETRLPFVDAELVDTLLAIPPEMKRSEKLQEHILRRHFPAFSNVVNANTGSRVGAGALAKRLTTLQLRVLAKLGVKGYQPYERLGLWLRRELSPLVRDILLNERCLGRGIFRPDAVRSVVEDHLNHRRNHTFLLLAMMIFEQGQRQFVDGEKVDTAVDAANT